MAAAVFRKVDLNRFSKSYPYLRRQPRYSYESAESFVLESTVVNFNGGNEVTYNFVNTYGSVPTVVATPQNDSFNVFVKAVSTTSVTVGASIENNESASIVVVSE